MTVQGQQRPLKPPRPPDPAPGEEADKDETYHSGRAMQMRTVNRSGGRFDGVDGAARRSRGRSLAPVEESTPLLPGVYNVGDDDAASATSQTSSVTTVGGFFRSLSRSILPSETEIVDLGLYGRAASSADSLDGSDGFDDEFDGSDDDYSDEILGDGVNSSREYSEGSFDTSGGGDSHAARKLPPHKQEHHRHHHIRVHRSLRRRIFLLLTEPQTSIVSAIFFVFLIVSITLSNVLMMLQTMNSFQFTPPDCVICGGSNEYYSTNDDIFYYGPTLPNLQNLTVPCVCPPVPMPEIVLMEDFTIWFFTVEWILRVICFEPAPTEIGGGNHVTFTQWLSYLTEWTTVLDALAIFPYYIERYEQTNGLLSLRLLRLFRVFQLLRLGKYNTTFTSLINVLGESLLSFNLLIIVLVFGAAFFGSMIYWLEKGVWKYTDYTDPPSFAYMRTAADGVSEEPSPFTSIPASFWWFIVTATTVGYGDTYPTSFGGKCVAGLAMLMGVLVIAFPVSVFSDLWSKELQKAGVLEQLDSEGQSIPEMHNHSTELVESRKPPKDADVGTRDRINLGGTQNDTTSDRNNSMLSTMDVETILSHLKRIDESQGEIRRILRKFQKEAGSVQGDRSLSMNQK